MWRRRLVGLRYTRCGFRAAFHISGFVARIPQELLDSEISVLEQLYDGEMLDLSK